VREVAQHVGIGGARPVVVGTPEKVADAVEAWFEQTDVDGLNMPFAVSPGDFERHRRHAVPELTGAAATGGLRQGTLREKLFGEGRARLTRSIRPVSTGRIRGRRRRSRSTQFTELFTTTSINFAPGRNEGRRQYGLNCRIGHPCRPPARATWRR
jgi:hypothetical protein